MQKTIVTALALLASTAAASATDLPGKKAPTAPLATFAQNTFYVGGNIGGNVGDARVYSGGAVAGWNVLPFLAVEGTYDLSRPQTKLNGDRDYRSDVMVNLVPQYNVPGTPVTVYALGGLGYRWSSVGADHSVYNVGFGAKYEVMKNVDIDARYRRIDGVKREDRAAEDRLTIGVNYKF